MPVRDSAYTAALAGRDQVIRSLYAALGIAALAVAVLGWGWMRAADDVRVFVPPDLTEGVVVRADEPQAAHVYAFAFHLWQQLYRWPTDGAADYAMRIDAFAAFLTPGCRAELADDARARAAEVRGRERAVWAIPGRGYRAEKVIRRGPGAWTAYLDLQIEETLDGTLVKERLVRYPVRVARYDVDRQKNAWGLAIACLDGVATAIPDRH